MPSIIPTKLKYVGEHFDSFERNGSGYKALCPAHNDNTPSLCLNMSKDGRVLIKCQAGCETEHVLEVVGLSFQDLMPDAKRIEATYDYRDEQGDLLYQVVRYKPKTFRQRRPKKDGGWNWSTKDVRRVLYGLPEMLSAKVNQTVYVVEGEKDGIRGKDLL